MSEDSLIGGNVTPNADTPPADNTPPADTPPADEGWQAPEWMSGFEVDTEIAQDPSLKAIQDVPSLIKSYVHAQKKMGMDKTVLPNQNSTKEEWMQLYQKLGMPTDFNEYDLKAAEQNALKEEVLEQFKQTAFDNNIMPNQAQAMYDFLNNQAVAEAAQQVC